jgi:formate-dependent nitrite reductase membrane component NrfD
MFTAYAGCGTFDFGSCGTVTALIDAVIGSFFALVWVVAIVFFVYGGLLWITSAGDKNKAETAKNALTQGIIGLVVVLGVNVIISIIQKLFTGGDAFIAPKVGTSIPGLN